MSWLRRIRPVAVIIGWLVDVVGSNVFYLVALAVFAATGRITASSLTDSAAITRLFAPSSDLFLVLTFGGLVMSAIAGYVAARVADREEILHGFVTSFGGLLFSVGQPQIADYPPLLWLGLVASGFIASTFGGWTRLRTKAVRV